jgi:hypothetical protein
MSNFILISRLIKGKWYPYYSISVTDSVIHAYIYFQSTVSSNSFGERSTDASIQNKESYSTLVLLLPERERMERERERVMGHFSKSPRWDSGHIIQSLHGARQYNFYPRSLFRFRRKFQNNSLGQSP